MSAHTSRLTRLGGEKLVVMSQKWGQSALEWKFETNVKNNK